MPFGMESLFPAAAPAPQKHGDGGDSGACRQTRREPGAVSGCLAVAGVATTVACASKALGLIAACAYCWVACPSLKPSTEKAFHVAFYFSLLNGWEAGGGWRER